MGCIAPKSLLPHPLVQYDVTVTSQWHHDDIILFPFTKLYIYSRPGGKDIFTCARGYYLYSSSGICNWSYGLSILDSIALILIWLSVRQLAKIRTHIQYIQYIDEILGIFEIRYIDEILIYFALQSDPACFSKYVHTNVDHPW